MIATEDRSADRVRLHADVGLAAKILAPYWPLDTFIAVNPLGGLEDLPFEDAIVAAAEILGARGTLETSAYRQAHAVGRVTDADLVGALRRRAPVALSLGSVHLGDREYSARELLICDLVHGAALAPAARRSSTLAEQVDPSAHAAANYRRRSGRRPSSTVDRLAGRCRDASRAFTPPGAPSPRTTARLPARSARSCVTCRSAPTTHCSTRSRPSASPRATGRRTSRPTWRACPDGPPMSAGAPIRTGTSRPWTCWRSGSSTNAPCWNPASSTTQRGGRTSRRRTERRRAPTGRRASARRSGVRAATSDEVAAVAGVLAGLPAEHRDLVWQEAYEGHYRDALLRSVATVQPSRTYTRPAAQLVCCIDVRSEGLRRHLEQLGEYDTLGFAGFFAVAIRYHDLAGGRPSALCPVLLSPRNEVHEPPAPGEDASARRQIAGRRMLAGAQDSLHAAKDDVMSPFALAEAAGWASAPLAAAKTLAAGPYGAVRERLRRRATPNAPTVIAPHESFAADERALVADASLTMMGLTRNFGRVVVLCGHGSATENNPYASALDCGACGGNRRGSQRPHSRRHPQRRRRPRAPAGLGTSTSPRTPGSAGRARHGVRSRHAARSPPGPRHRTPTTSCACARGPRRLRGSASAPNGRSHSPGAPSGATPRDAARHVRRPEHGLGAGVPRVGAGRQRGVHRRTARTITRGLDLGRRCFLHSYEADVDADGAALETILTAPLVVAQWISVPVLLLDRRPGRVRRRHQDDPQRRRRDRRPRGPRRRSQARAPLAVGRRRRPRLVHEPMRLLARRSRCPWRGSTTIVARNTVLQHLFGNGWVALAAREYADRLYGSDTPPRAGGPGQPKTRSSDEPTTT